MDKQIKNLIENLEDQCVLISGNDAKLILKLLEDFNYSQVSIMDIDKEKIIEALNNVGFKRVEGNLGMTSDWYAYGNNSINIEKVLKIFKEYKKLLLVS